MSLDEVLSLLALEPTSSIDLAESALLLATDEYPDLDIPIYLSQLDDLAEQLQPRMRGSLKRRIQELNRFLFDEHGFRGNTEDYYDPRNSYLNEVFDRQLGIPITLSILVIAVGQRVGLDLVGVGLPGHFISKAVEGDQEVLFDPFHQGQILTRSDCRELVERVTHAPFQLKTEHLEATSAGMVMMRMLNNLKGIYLQQSDLDRTARVMKRCCQLVPEDPTHQRDLGIVLAQMGRYGSAIEPLKFYLKQIPEADDATDVQELLQRAKNEVARWN